VPALCRLIRKLRSVAEKSWRWHRCRPCEAAEWSHRRRVISGQPIVRYHKMSVRSRATIASHKGHEVMKQESSLCPLCPSCENIFTP